MREEWTGFSNGAWTSEVNVRDFIQKNYTPYDGDASFLAELEESDITANTKNIGKKHTEEVEPVQISLFDTMGMVAEQPKKSEVEETLKKLDISNMTPMEAMNQLYELQKKCK